MSMLRPASFALLLLLNACGDDGDPSGADAGGGRIDGAAGDGGGTTDTGTPGEDTGVPETCEGGCDDGDDCTVDSCDEESAVCRHTARDVDGDGHGDAACGGDDCDDGDALRYT